MSVTPPFHLVLVPVDAETMSDFAEKVEPENPNAEDGGDDDDNGPAVVHNVACDRFAYAVDDCLCLTTQQEESTATFVPVVTLEAVEIKTHEEDEDVLYKQYVGWFV